MLFRYPGGKGKISKFIIRKIVPYFENGLVTEFIEPFMGSGAVTFALLQDAGDLVPRLWINDKDPGICAIWNVIRDDHTNLTEAIEAYKPSVSDFFAFKQELSDMRYLNAVSPLEIAIKKIAVHQMSFSGLGTKAGSPIGGKDQFDADGNPKKYGVDCRWSPKHLVKSVNTLHKQIRDKELIFGHCTSEEYSFLLSRCNDDSFIYLDPPYYGMGEQLYEFSFSEQDHIKMADMLRNKNNWLLSYDNHDRIRELYDWANIEEVGIKYTINNKTDQAKELLICPKR